MQNRVRSSRIPLPFGADATYDRDHDTAARHTAAMTTTPTRHARRIVVTLVAAATLVSTAPSPAGAETERLRDRRDSYGMPAKKEAPYDIRKARFVNDRRHVRAVVHLRNLWRHSSGWMQLNLSVGTSKWYSVQVRRHRNGKQDVRRSGVKRCPGLVARYRVRRDAVRFSIPQRCLKDGGRHGWRMTAWVGALPTRDANAWDATREPRVSYR